MTARVHVIRSGVIESGAVDEIPGLLADPEAVLWVDLEGPDPHDVRLMESVFKFHPLAIENTRNQRQRPKVEEYEDYVLLILNPVYRSGDTLSLRELDVFLSERYLVTVHRHPDRMLREAESRCRAAGLPQLSAGYVAYAILDTVIDGYFPVLDSILETVDRTEDLMLEEEARVSLSSLFSIKRSLLDLQRVLSSQRDVFTFLNRRDLRFFPEDVLRYYLRDVQEHVLHLNDQVAMARDLAGGLIELYLTVTSNRLNHVVNRLTVATLLIGIVTVVTGFYGMNFPHLWPLEAEWGVPFAIGLMLALAAALLTVLRRLRWW